MNLPTGLRPSDLASQPKAGLPNFSPANLLLAIGAADRGGILLLPGVSSS